MGRRVLHLYAAVSADGAPADEATMMTCQLMQLPMQSENLATKRLRARRCQPRLDMSSAVTT
eukprot:5416914-Karenia_brevis.AAC.1